MPEPTMHTDALGVGVGDFESGVLHRFSEAAMP